VDTVLDAALITAPDARDPALIARLDLLLARTLGRQS
jgi:5'-methylthioadenosine phosphorylase